MSEIQFYERLSVLSLAKCWLDTSKKMLRPGASPRDPGSTGVGGPSQVHFMAPEPRLGSSQGGELLT